MVCTPQESVKKAKKEGERLDNQWCASPEGWEWKMLINVLSSLENGTRPKGGVDNIEEGVPSVGGEHLNKDGGFIFENIKFIPKEFYESMRRGRIERGDVLVVKDGATTGKVSLVRDDYPYQKSAVNEHVFICRPNQKYILPEYLFYNLFSPLGQNKILRSFHGAAQGGINTQFANDYEIPLPPLPTQRRIVSILEKAEETARLRAQADELTDRLLQSVFMEMFGDPVKNPKKWEVVKFGNLWFHYSHGYAGRNNLGNPSGTLILRIRNVLNDRIVYKKLDREEIASEYVPKYALETGNLLMVRVNGSPEEIGRSVIFHEFNEVVIHDDNIIRIVLDSGSVLPEYIQALLKSRYVRSKIAKTCKSTAGQYLLSKTKLFEIDVPCPPLHLQQKFARIVEKVESMRQFQNQSKQQIEDLFSALMQKAFRGELDKSIYV